MPPTGADTNWAGNYAYAAGTVHHPRDMDELRAVVSTAEKLQVLGTRHSFTSIGDSGELIALDRLDCASDITIDRAALTVTLGPQVTFARLAETLNREGLALANLASLPHISVVGGIVTATHGSGDRQGNLATSVVAMQLVTAAGDVRDYVRGDDVFEGSVVNLGKLGVVTSVTLAVEPYYELAQEVYEGLAWDDLLAHFDEVTAAGRSVSIFHRFEPRTRQVWVKYPLTDAGRPGTRGELLGTAATREPRNPVPGADPANCTLQGGVPGPWSDRLPHFRSGFTPSFGEEIQSEFFVARGDVAAALTALQPLAHRIRPLLLIAELRTVAGDALWLSPQYGRASVGLHFTWRRRQAEVEAVVAEIERALAPLGARPHWGKLFTMPRDALAALYPRACAFGRLRDELDPRGVFTNRWFREHGISS
jgi:xylitol oxidase